jgi:hypothetical protein
MACIWAMGQHLVFCHPNAAVNSVLALPTRTTMCEFTPDMPNELVPATELELSPAAGPR